MIKFKDYPDTSTLLNAENINVNFNELKNEYGANNVDANNYQKTGMYYLATGCTNVPASYVRLIVNGYGTQNGGNDVIQIAISVLRVPDVWVRTKATGTWYPWRLLAKGYTGDIAAGTNFNTLTTRGVFQYGGLTATNAPPNFGVFEVLGGPDYTLQRCTGSSNTYTRFSSDNGATWSSWR